MSKFFAAASSVLFVMLLMAAEPGAALAQEPSDATTQTGNAVTDETVRGTRVPLAQAATAFDATGREALSATLLTQALAGTPAAPARNARIVVRNAGQAFYNYVTGYTTFYDEGGTRCGTGLFTFEAAAAGERIEADMPGLRLTCTPATWRIVATTLLTPAGDTAQPGATTQQTVADATTPALVTESSQTGTQSLVPPLEINVNGRTIPIQLGNPLEIVVGTERIRIVVQPAP